MTGNQKSVRKGDLAARGIRRLSHLWEIRTLSLGISPAYRPYFPAAFYVHTPKARLLFADGPSDQGGRYWVRTSDLFGVNEALSH